MHQALGILFKMLTFASILLSSRTRPIGSYFQSDSSSSTSAYVLSNSKTRLISSYFQSNPKQDREQSPLEEQLLEALSPAESDLAEMTSDLPDTTANLPEMTADATISENMDSSDTIESDSETVDLIKAEDSPYNPFISQKHEVIMEDDYYAHANDNGPFGKSEPTASDGEPSWHDELPADLASIDSLGVMAFSSQLSGESLRRLTLSPRKQKKKNELLPESMASMPTLTFSEKLAAEMGDSDQGEDVQFDSVNKPGTLKFVVKGVKEDEKEDVEDDTKEEVNEEDVELAVIEGSDPGSETDWNDDEIHKHDKPTSPTALPDLSMELAEAPLESDDDIPTLSRFAAKNSKLILEESDSDLSDLEDDPFSSNTSGVSSPTSMTMRSSAGQPKEDGGIHMDNSDNEYEPKNELDSRRPRTTRTAALPRPGRNLRSSTIKPVLLPISPPKPTPKPARVNKKPVLFSLDTLLDEKKRRAQIGYDLKAAKTQMTLDEELLEEYDDDENEDSFFGTDMIPKNVLSEEQEGALTEIIGDEQVEIIEDVAEFFVQWPQELVVQPLESELIDTDLADPVVQKVLKCTQTGAQRTQFLTSPFLMIMSSSPWSMPRSLFRWLVHIVAVEQNQSVTLSVFALLQRIFSQRTSLLGVDHQDLIRAFKMYGAKEEYLGKDWSVTPVTRGTRNERLILPETKKFPRQNLKAVIKLVNMTATLHPQFYDVVEVRKVMNLLLRITTDPIIGDIKSLLGSTLVALLDAIPANLWEAERRMICEETIQTLGTSLPFMLLALRQLPSLSVRITLLRRSIALAYLNQPPILPGEIAPNLEELHRALFVDRGFLVNSETFYKDLGRRFQIFGFCLDDEQMIAAYGRKALEPLLRKLRLIHGRIVDVRAAFMERTWAKDIIQRLYMRLYYAGIHRQIAKQSTLSFGVSASNQKQLTQSLNASGQHLAEEPTPSSEVVKNEIIKTEETLHQLPDSV
ncbi:hypothetical protein BGX27_006996 [Mortierella sp. AM989]|nr:hypothetical protein BGX27_006996 [Mortierella sp. AM989]